MHNLQKHKMMKKIILAIALLAGLTACEKDSLLRYDLGRHIHFTQTNEENVTDFSFAHYPGYDSYTCTYDVRLMGDLTTEDLAFALEIDPKSTATAEMYELDQAPLFKKGADKGSFSLTLKNPDGILHDREVTLIVHIAANKNFEPGFKDYRTLTVNFGDKASKPLWWDATVEIYLGAYDENKFREFVVCTSIVSLAGVEESLIRKYALEFKVYIEQHGLDIQIPAY